MSTAQAEPLRFPVKSRVIENFKVGSDETRFGPLEFMGGLELSASTDALGAMLVGTPELSCTESEASGLVHRVSHSLACLAAWPRLVLDDGSTGG